MTVWNYCEIFSLYIWSLQFFLSRFSSYLLISGHFCSLSKHSFFIFSFFFLIFHFYYYCPYAYSFQYIFLFYDKNDSSFYYSGFCIHIKWLTNFSHFGIPFLFCIHNEWKDIYLLIFHVTFLRVASHMWQKIINSPPMFCSHTCQTRHSDI